MELIEQADELVAMILTATPRERIGKLALLALPNKDGEYNKGAIKRLNKLCMSILKARDEIAVELQQEDWKDVQQLDLSFTIKAAK